MCMLPPSFSIKKLVHSKIVGLSVQGDSLERPVNVLQKGPARSLGSYVVDATKVLNCAITLWEASHGMLYSYQSVIYMHLVKHY